MRYPIILYPYREAYSVLVPDLPGCISQRDTPEEAIEKAKEAIRLHLANQTKVPKASTIDQVIDPEEPDALYAYVEVKMLVEA